MKYFFKDNKKPDLCLVFCGWGTDERLYLPLLKDFDYLLCFDYDKEINFEMPISTEKYENFYMLCYSAGGGAAAILKDKLPKLKTSVAVNASVELIGRYGLSEKVLSDIKKLNLDNYIDFRRKYMVTNEEELDLFCKNQPLRSFESCFKELDAIEYLAKAYKGATFDFDKVYVAKDDPLLPMAQQKEYFGNKIIEIEGSHFPFYRYNSFIEFFND